MMVPQKLIFLTRSLSRGGAERQLAVLAGALQARGHSLCVLAMYADKNGYESYLEQTGVRLVHLGKKGRWDVMGFLWRLFCQIRKEKPTVLYTYLGVPNILTVILKPFLPKMKVVWGVRASDMDLSRYDWISRLSYRLECFLSRFADLIICNSQAGKTYAAKNGFPEDRLIVIPNGIDTEVFRFSSDARQTMRRMWGIADDTLVIGLVGRLDPMKDHGNFLKAARLVLDTKQNVHFLCVGSGETAYATSLERQAADLNLEANLSWLPAQDHIQNIYNGMDIICSASAFGEGFSNVLTEAMACELPCVATDVGDSRMLVGDAGLIVPPGDEVALAAALLKLVALSPKSRRALGQAGRAHIVAEFSQRALAIRTEAALGLDSEKSQH
jgi:glycosyltransferase involved in cell wall biosynthesis